MTSALPPTLTQLPPPQSPKNIQPQNFPRSRVYRHRKSAAPKPTSSPYKRVGVEPSCGDRRLFGWRLKTTSKTTHTNTPIPHSESARQNCQNPMHTIAATVCTQMSPLMVHVHAGWSTPKRSLSRHNSHFFSHPWEGEGERGGLSNVADRQGGYIGSDMIVMRGGRCSQSKPPCPF